MGADPCSSETGDLFGTAFADWPLLCAATTCGPACCAPRWAGREACLFYPRRGHSVVVRLDTVRFEFGHGFSIYLLHR